MLLLGIVALLLVAVSFVAAGRPAAIPYGAFIDLRDAANAAAAVWSASRTQTILVALGAIISFKPMLLVFGGLLVAGAVRAMEAPVRIAQPAAATKESIT